MNPPAKALVLSVDEKSQIQALDRTEPILPLRPGLPARQTHDYTRHGTTTLFAALNVLEGHVIEACQPRHTHAEFLVFLDKIDRQTSRRRDIHLILDNYGTHTHPTVKAWMLAHPRFHFHFTPTGASWLNLVERFFAEITRKRIRRGTFRSVPALIAAIRAYVREHNHHPRPFIWTASAAAILRRFKHCKQVLETGHKDWRNVQELDSLRSFAIELILAHLQDADGAADSLERGLLRAFLYIAQTELKEPISFPENGALAGYPDDVVVIVDPVNKDNNVTKRLTDTERREIVKRATEAWELITTARRNAFKGETVQYWKEALGRSFLIEEE